MKRNNDNIDNDIIDIISKHIKSYRFHSSIDHSEEISNETCRDVAISIMSLIAGK